MSVINRMLRSLDARGVAASPPKLPASPGKPASATPRWRLPAILLGGGAVIAFTAFADWPKHPATPQQPAVVAIAEPVPANAAPASAAAAVEAALPAPTRAPVEAVPVPLVVAIATPRAAPVAAPAPPAARPVAPSTAQPNSALLDLPPLVPATPPRIDKRTQAPTPEQRIAALYRQAVDSAQAGRREAALGQARELLALDRQHSAARQLAALLEHEGGADERAVQLLREGLALDPQQPALALLLARLQVAQSAPAEALATLDRFTVAGAEADGLRAGILAQRGDFKGSLKPYENAARQQPTNPMWWLGLGVALESEGEPARARQAYAKAQAIGLPREDLASYVDQRLRAID